MSRQLPARTDHGDKKDERTPGDGKMNAVDRREVEFSLELTRRPHRGQSGRDEVLDHSVGVPDFSVDSVARGGHRQLLDCSADGRLHLQPWILDERFQHDRSHFVVEAIESAKAIKHALAPEKIMGGRRQLVAMFAKLETRIRAMIVEIAGYDTRLQHPAEHDSHAAWRPGGATGNRIVGCN